MNSISGEKTPEYFANKCLEYMGIKSLTIDCGYTKIIKVVLV